MIVVGLYVVYLNYENMLLVIKHHNSLLRLIETFDQREMKTALIIVDVQNDFCEGGSLEVPNANQIIQKINALSQVSHTTLRCCTLSPQFAYCTTVHFVHSSVICGACNSMRTKIKRAQNFWFDNSIKGLASVWPHFILQKSSWTRIIFNNPNSNLWPKWKPD